MSRQERRFGSPIENPKVAGSKPFRRDGKGDTISPRELRPQHRHSLHVEYPAKDRLVRMATSPNDAYQSTGSLRSHARRTSKDVLLSSFRSVARRLSRTSWNSPRDPSASDPITMTGSFHNASTTPEPVLGVEPLRGAGEPYIDNDHMSDTLSEKYPLPEDIENDDSENREPNSSFPVLVVQTLSKYTFLEDERGCELALRSLRNLSIDISSHGLLTKVGGIRAALSAMERFSTNMNIQQLGLLFLGDISRTSTSNKRHIGQNGGLQLINRILLDSESADVHVLERACITLRTICASCNYNAVLTGVCGTADAVLKTMRRWKRCAALQERCLDVLTTLVHDAPENASTVMDAGATSEILSTLRQYGKQLDVQISALRAACEIARSSEAARDDMGEAGILSDLLKGLQTFTNSSEYTTSAARCVRYLAFSGSNRARITRTSLASELVGRLEVWHGDRRVVAAILQALANVTYDEEIGKMNVVKGNGAAALLGILEAHASDGAVCEAACRVLRNASDGNIPTKRLAGRHGAINRVASTLRKHGGRVGVQEHGCATLINLWSTHEAQIRAAALETHLARASNCHAEEVDACQQIDGLRVLLARPSSARGRTSLLCLVPGAERRQAESEDESTIWRSGISVHVEGARNAASMLSNDIGTPMTSLSMEEANQTEF